ncbi:ribosomal protection-like ABC-F family protein [Paenibacillus senegalensis]|uniref:ribosomal protection-like ABC-F family protein n=1 Tax=Paenibacillus senegalensis TaxID=1465766 RepID=UPI00028A0B20|nr:ABC-F type ribosomal protection protein [Paenibacillus senegalensis]
MIIQFNEVSYFYGAEQVLENVNFDIKEGERIGLIGRNGSGKTTVFRLLSGMLTPHAGQVHRRKGCRVGLLEQVPSVREDCTVYDVLSESFEQLKQWQAELRRWERHMSDPVIAADEGKMAELLHKYGQTMERFQQAGGYEMDARIDKVASGLGISPANYERLFQSLSGGEKTKVCLAAVLLQAPDVLLLDEPTNHLDSDALEWLEAYLVSYQGTVIVVSHDRYFLDCVVGKIIEIEDREAVIYYTNYSGYQKEKEERLLREFAQYEEQQKKIRKMQETIKQLKEWGNRSNPPNPSFHRRAASMEKALERMVKLKRPVLERKSIGLALDAAGRSGKRVLAIKEVGKKYADRTLWKPVDLQVQYGERIAILGENGSGKTTLLRMLTGQETSSSGEIHWGARVSIGFLAQEEHPPENAVTVLHYFREQAAMEEGKARAELARFLFYGTDVFKQVSQLSGGEWSRLRLALLMHQQPNVLLLDEPTNHLDIDSREALEEALLEYTGTVLAISHDRYFINRLFSKLWILEDAEWHVFAGNYNDYSSKKKAAARSIAESNSKAGTEKANLKPDRSNRKQRSASEPDSNLDASSYEDRIMELEARLEKLESELSAWLEAKCSVPLEQEGSFAEAVYKEKAQDYLNLKNQLERLYQKWVESGAD